MSLDKTPDLPKLNGSPCWYLFLHQLPPKPPYFRAKVLRQLNKLGALAIKNSAYLLPANEDTLEDLQWVRRLILSGDGESWLFEAEAIEGFTTQSLKDAFRDLSRRKYEDVAGEARTLLEEQRQDADVSASADDEAEGTKPPEYRLRKLKRRYAGIRRTDFFQAPEGPELAKLLGTIESTLEPGTHIAPHLSFDIGSLQGRKWVTRRGIKVDRMASAWLIERFIDSTAEFQFVDPSDYEPGADDIRFDMFEGEFTHEGDMCTFEVLLVFLKLSDPALNAIAEIVHDIDLKDGKFGREETAGIAMILDGIVETHDDDKDRLAKGHDLFGSLYQRNRLKSG